MKKGVGDLMDVTVTSPRLGNGLLDTVRFASHAGSLFCAALNILIWAGALFASAFGYEIKGSGMFELARLSILLTSTIFITLIWILVLSHNLPAILSNFFGMGEGFEKSLLGYLALTPVAGVLSLGGMLILGSDRFSHFSEWFSLLSGLCVFLSVWVVKET